MATEVAIFKLKAGKHPGDANSMAGQVMKDTLNTLTEQKGFQRAYWGTEEENADVLRLFVDWDSVDDHIAFTKSEPYKPFMDRFGQIAELDSAQLSHAHFKPHPASQALSDHVSPVTAITTIIFSSDVSDADQEKVADAFTQQCENIANTSDKYMASAGGLMVEELPIPDTAEKGKAYVGLTGWQSMEDHMLWRGTSAYDENVRLMKQFHQNIRHVDLKHFSGTQVSPGGGGVADASGGSLPNAQEEILNPQGGIKNPPKTRADGTTTKNSDELKGAANALHKERAGR